MSNLVGPGGQPLAPAPQSPFIDMPGPEGVIFRLPVTAVGIVTPDVLDQLVHALAPMVAQIVADLLQGKDPLNVVSSGDELA